MGNMLSSAEQEHTMQDAVTIWVIVTKEGYPSAHEKDYLRRREDLDSVS
jgi:hypothetical protein